VVGIVDHGLGPQQALELPRFLPGGRSLQIEDGFAPRVLRELEAIGQSFQPISLMGELRMGYGAAVVIDGNRVRAGGDPRRSGTGGATR
jgi:gamma-glutamyltranspeptidase